MPRRSAARTMPAPRRGVRLRFFGDIISELRKAVWPTRRETVRLTLMVIAVSVSVGLFLGAIDYGFAQMARFLLPSS